MRALTFAFHWEKRVRHRTPWGVDKTSSTYRHTLAVKIQRSMMIVRSAESAGSIYSILDQNRDGADKIAF